MTIETEKFNKFNKPERNESMNIDPDKTFEFTPKQEPISFSPVGGDLEKIGIDSKEKIILLPPKEDNEYFSKNKTAGFLILNKEEAVNCEEIKKWCAKNGWRLATGFELANLYEQLWKEFGDDVERRKKLTTSDPERFKNDYSKLASLEHTIAVGDNYKGNYVSATVPQWDWALTLYSSDELNSSFKFVVVKL